MAGNIEQLVDELERSYQEAQERMSDPAVYNDHREAAAAGRRLKELEAPHRVAQARVKGLLLSVSEPRSEPNRDEGVGGRVRGLESGATPWYTDAFEFSR